jgi:ABC-2 type transport system ATP-binding protein
VARLLVDGGGGREIDHVPILRASRATSAVTAAARFGDPVENASVTTPAIETHALRKAYGRTVALEALDIRVEPGEVFGFLGPNGAGKTTSVKLLLGLTRPTAGDGQVLGRPLGDLRARARIGYLPELFRYQAWLTAREVISLHARLAGLDAARRTSEIERVLALVGLAARADDRTGGFSKGMQQRLGLAAALIGDPELVILDEPTSALDPVGRDDVRAIIRHARERGSAVLLNSHLLGEVERLCDRVAIVNKGRVVAAGALTDLLGQSAVRLRVTDLPPDRATLASFGEVVEEGGWLIVRSVDPERIPDLVAAIVALGGRVHAVDPGRQSLEDLFLGLVREPETAA